MGLSELTTDIFPMKRPLILAMLLALAISPAFAAESNHHAAPVLAIPGTPAARAAESHQAETTPATTHAKPADDTHATAAPEEDSASPDQILRELKEGNLRFVSDRMIHDLTSLARRSEIAEGQHPGVTILSCSDSRVPPEIIFDKGLGEIFSIRVAGNVADTDEIGSIEYGVGHLHTPILLVLGHTSCGAVTAVAQNAAVGGSIPKLIDNIVPAVLRAKDEASTPAGIIDAAVRANVWVSIEDIFHRSDEVRQLAVSGKLRVIGAVYDLQTGIVSWMGAHPSQKALIAGSVKTPPLDALPGEQHRAAAAIAKAEDVH
ncbi:carbonic anhydrase [bacterium]|nr:carbonic anhydrase [bacterium]